MQFDDVQRTSTQPDAGRCSRSAPEVRVKASRRARGSSEVRQRVRQAVVDAPAPAVDAATATTLSGKPAEAPARRGSTGHTVIRGVHPQIPFLSRHGIEVAVPPANARAVQPKAIC